MEKDPVSQMIKLPLLQARSNLWYGDPNDSRCPHDAWLKQLDLSIESSLEDEDECHRTLRLDLLGAYHDGVISFTYQGVISYNIILKTNKTAGKISRRVDWLEDSATQVSGGHIQHSIQWEVEKWIIEAQDITYEWRPFESPQNARVQ